MSLSSTPDDLTEAAPPEDDAQIHRYQMTVFAVVSACGCKWKKPQDSTHSGQRGALSVPVPPQAHSVTDPLPQSILCLPECKPVPINTLPL